MGQPSFSIAACTLSINSLSYVAGALAEPKRLNIPRYGGEVVQISLLVPCGQLAEQRAARVHQIGPGLGTRKKDAPPDSMPCSAPP